MKITALDHVALHVSDLAVSCAFYRDALRLEQLPRPDFSFPGAWFALGPKQTLHLIARPPKEFPYNTPRERHFALRVQNLPAAHEHLTQQGIEHQPPKLRPDGAGQIFLRDPDGHVIELTVPYPHLRHAGSQVRLVSND